MACDIALDSVNSTFNDFTRRQKKTEPTSHLHSGGCHRSLSGHLGGCLMSHTVQD